MWPADLIFSKHGKSAAEKESSFIYTLQRQNPLQQFLLQLFSVYTCKQILKYINTYEIEVEKNTAAFLTFVSLSKWTGLGADCAGGRGPCPRRGAGTSWSVRSLPTQTSLWFYENLLRSFLQLLLHIQ